MFLNIYISMYCFALITPLGSSKISCSYWKWQGVWTMTLFDIPPFDEPDSMCMFLMLVLWYGLIYRYTIIIFVVHLTLWPDTILMNTIVITWTRKILFINWLNIKTNYIVNFTCDIIIKLHTPKCYILEMTVTWKWDAWPSEVWNPPALYIMYWQTNSSNIFISGWRSMFVV